MIIIIIRLTISAWLIYMVARGHTWALVVILVLLALASEIELQRWQE